MPFLDLHEKIAAFTKAEQFEMSPGYAKLQEKILVDSGLSEETGETLLEMKRVFYKYREEIKEREQRREKFKKR